jgi:ribose transport system substrate-binding protein
MLQALRQRGLAGKVTFVGFDPTLALVEAMRKGEVNALVSQNPHGMGRKTVEAAVAKVRGQSIPEKTDTGCVLVTPANLDQPAIQVVLKPQMN